MQRKEQNSLVEGLMEIVRFLRDMYHFIISAGLLLLCMEGLIAQERLAPPSLPHLVAKLIQTGDEELLEDIVMSEKHFAAMLELQLKRSPTKVSEAEIQKLAKSSAEQAMTRARDSLMRFKEATKEGFGDMREAQLVRILDRDGRPMVEDAKQIHTDILLEMKVRSKVFTVKLDDCFHFLGQRRLGDSFKLVR